ncbi:hypothetical protein TIFTF001_024556 [Ficus carica]|uniref:Uncharacterized protein n=1 Tax=Ficus carica TaxID=3494 RepID=A0AA88B0S4_FICCA|nr:hypothetical protein TIFTF001_024556 [Ficus carica]
MLNCTVMPHVWRYNLERERERVADLHVLDLSNLIRPPSWAKLHILFTDDDCLAHRHRLRLSLSQPLQPV